MGPRRASARPTRPFTRSFFVPHDPYGLLNLPGQAGFVQRLVDYCRNHAWFNDYQEFYPYLLFYAGAANRAQEILRKSWIPLFEAGVIYEGVKPKPLHGGWQTHYTGVSGWLLCSMLGLCPSSAPDGQFIISSPAVGQAVIHHGKNTIPIQTRNNSDQNIYVRSIKVNGAVYPAYMIPASRLTAGARLELLISSDPKEGLGDLYVASSDGFIRAAPLEPGDEQSQFAAFHHGDQDGFGRPVQGLDQRRPVQAAGGCRGRVLNRRGQAVGQGQLMTSAHLGEPGVKGLGKAFES
jgi:Glycosyl hydrolase family 92 catalytic domain